MITLVAHAEAWNFHNNRGNKPRNWVTAMRVVEVVRSDDMRERLLMRL